MDKATTKKTTNLQRRLTKTAYDIFIKRYSLKNDEGRLVEQPEDIIKRVAEVVAYAENNYRDGLTISQIADRFEDLMLKQKFLPNGRTLANAGSQLGQLANCFVLPISDELGKTETGIFSTLRKAILILQTGGGVGFSFGQIRPKGDSIGSSKGKATGAVSFLKIYDTAFDIIGQGGGRRSAAMAVLPVWHPDIVDFVSVKQKEGLIVNFNISVGITDGFMKAAAKDEWFYLVNPRTQETWRRIKAKKLFQLIVDNSYNNGEPGVLFLDTAQASNPIPNVYQLEATNPCGEQFLGPYENCCLGSINLLTHVKKTWTVTKGKASIKLTHGQIDWDKLAETTYWAVRFLDDVIDANRYVSAVPELAEAAKKARRIGLSIMGLADLMYEVGVAYDSKQGIGLASLIIEFIRYHAIKTSVELAKERGPFPLIKDSIYDARIVGTSQKLGRARGWRPPAPLFQSDDDFGRPKLNWPSLVRLIKKHGIRNAAQMTIAPTGAIATISALEGYGCEPVFALSYLMKTHEGAGDDYRQIYYESRLFKKAIKRLKQAGVELDQTLIFNQIRQQGSCQQISGLPDEIKRIYKVSQDISAKDQVKMQAAMQAFVDNSISKTINFPPSTKPADIAQAYRLAWRLGCKGMTAYVSGSRKQEVLQSQTDSKPDFSSHADNDEANGFRTSKLTKVANQDEVCTECGQLMTVSEGCYTCPTCGYSKCDG